MEPPFQTAYFQPLGWLLGGYILYSSLYTMQSNTLPTIVSDQLVLLPDLHVMLELAVHRVIPSSKMGFGPSTRGNRGREMSA